MNPDLPTPATTLEPAVAHALAEPFGLALLTWPAAAAAVHLGCIGETGWQVAALAWLALFVLAAYGGRRGAPFGSVMLLTSGVVAGAAWLHPSPWAWAALPLLLAGLHGAQRARLRALGALAAPPSA